MNKNTNRMPAALVTAMASLALPATVQAQPMTAASLLELSLAELINTPIVTASRSAEKRDQTPAHVVVVTREQIRERRYKNLADLLEDMPGVDFQRGTKSSQYNQFTVQGNLGPNRLLVLMDGIRISQPSAGSYPVAENLALYQAKQVEFLYGPAAALYGADAVSGVINIVTEAGNQNDGSWLSVGGGNFSSAEYSFMSGFNGERVRLSLGGHWQESERARLDRLYKSHFRKVDANTFDGNLVIPANAREKYQGEVSSHSIFARLDVDERLTLGYYRHHYTNLTSTVDPYSTTRYSSKARWITTSDTLYGRYRFHLADHLAAQLQVDYSRMEVDPSSHYNNRYNDYQPGYSYSYGRRIGIEQSFDWTWSKQQQVQFGLGTQRFKAIEGGSMPFKYDTGSSANNQGMFYPNTGLPMRIAHERYHSHHAYLQLLSQWHEQFSTTMGVRFDHHSAYGDTLNPRLGLVWKPAEQHLFKLMYAEAFRAPSSEESLGSYGTFSGTTDASGNYEGSGFRVANPNLEPEKSRTIGLVWEWRPLRNLNLITNLYHSRITDLIVTGERRADNRQAIPGAVLRQASQKINAGNQYQTGLDLSAQWRYRMGRNWSGDLWASAGWIRGRIKEDNTEKMAIPYVAEYRFKAGTTLRYQDHLTLTSKLRWTDRVTNGRTRPPADGHNLPPAACNSTKKAPDRCTTPGHTLLDMHLGWHHVLDSPASLWLDVYNVTDKRYYAAAGSASYTFWDMPQQPRTWVLSMEWQF
jgi:outer membrane receptor protein involved in Fe transport